MERIGCYFSQRFVPRWLVLMFDLSAIPIAYFFAFLLRFNLNLPRTLEFVSPAHLLFIVPVFILFFRLTKSYSGIVRYSTTVDILRIVAATVFSTLLLLIISNAARQLNVPTAFVLPYSIIIIQFLLLTFILILFRLMVKAAFLYISPRKKEVKRVMIFGAGKMGQITRNILSGDSSSNVELIGFIDDNTSLQNKISAGIPIYSEKKAFETIISKKKVQELIIAIEPSGVTHQRKREIADLCIKYNILIKEVPPVKSWINGELKAKSIRKIDIEDLLGRDSIQLEKEKIEQGLKDAVVLVTGAAGSIGSEIVRQLISFHVKRVILLDKAESELYDLQNEILSKNNPSQFDIIVGDVTNKEKMRKIFSRYLPSIVFNAAAYKHVPLMEDHPCEALRVNVGGTKILADLSIEFNVDKFVFISTDKAVNPTNVMGASKRISEIYIQSLVQSGNIKTKFITTRFGNVLGSNGSVVPLFKKQIERGGPVTVTHKDITRYFMTIPEACQLVLEAGFMGKGGEIFIFDMGEPVRIYDLAKKMIRLSGYIPGQDIELIITGLRPGEKLYEELLDNKELLLPTHNDKILIGKVRKHDFNLVNNKIQGLLQDLDKKSAHQMIKQMMNIAPEFVSVNSCYSECNTGINGNSTVKTNGNENGKSTKLVNPEVQFNQLLAPEN